MARQTPVFLLLLGLLSAPLAAGENETGPDFKDVLSLEEADDPRISPDGEAVVYTVTSTDWEGNRYDRELFLARRGEEPFQLTRTDGESSSGAEWSPDGRRIAFLADRGGKTQVHVIRAAGGEAFPLTAVEDGVNDFEWSPDGRSMAVLLTETREKSQKKREERYGKFAVEDAEYRLSHLWLLDVAKAEAAKGGAKRPPDEDGDEDSETEETKEAPALRRLTGGDDFTVNDFVFSPDGSRIAFSHRPDPLITSYDKSDLSVLDVASGAVRSLVARPGSDGDPIFSPDGEWVLFSTADGKTAFYVNGELAKVPVTGGDVTVLTRGFDEDPSAVAWLEDGIRFLANQRTSRALFHLDPETGEVRRLTEEPPVVTSVDFSADGKRMALSGYGPTSLDEVYAGPAEPYGPERLTRMTDQVAGWDESTSEVISWTSRDGAEIEGVLVKPHDFEPDRRYPLLVLIHGGPTAVSRPQRVYGYVYPVTQWLAKGAVVLLPNYRGSTGYGEAFRSLNVRNLGVGDAWDVLSGVEHLVREGIADEERLGAMGWSQGGYISAFLATTSDRFKAISVGAGISNWMTYYVNTDIHPFTRHYLEATPWDDPEIYDKTSPMHYVRQASTPTLIQHGEFDRRVPIPNAYELFQGLQDVGVETRLVVYKGFGHGINKPKERLAAVWHNWQWFAKHLWGEEVELPVDGPSR